MLRRRLVSRLVLVTCVTLAVVALASAAFGLYLARLSARLPDLTEIEPASVTPQNSIVYAADGTVLVEWHGEQNRRIVSSAQLSDDLKHAVVAIEDRRFYAHDGVDLQALIRAATVNASSGEVRQGGSTITQQLVKLVYTKGERNLRRKLEEVLLAYDLEANADKDEVLAAYLNTVYFGHGAYGAEEAARHYFGTSASALTLPQSALLAAIIRSPSGYDPVAEPEKAAARRDLVLQEMSRQGFISAASAAEAATDPVKLAAPKDSPQLAPYFVEYVKQGLIRELGADRVYGGGLRIYTSLEPQLQRRAEAAASMLSRKGDPSVAIVTVRPSDGAVLAMVGGQDYQENQFNLATQARRQPGSAFKPFVLVAALEKGIKPSERFSAAPYEVRVKDGVWRVENFENSIRGGSLSLSQATNWSVNAVYARLVIKVGAERVAAAAKKMGIETPLEANPAIALGGLSKGVSPLEMARAYSAIANGGSRVEAGGVDLVTDDEGKLIVPPRSGARRVLRSSIAEKSAKMLHDVVERGTGKEARIGRWAAGKTGTTQSYRDAWFVGWSGDLCTAVWVGHPEAQIAMTDVRGKKVTGGSVAAKIWARYMRDAVTMQDGDTDEDPGAQRRTVGAMVTLCPSSAQLASPECPKPEQIWLPRDSVPNQVCTLHK